MKSKKKKGRNEAIYLMSYCYYVLCVSSFLRCWKNDTILPSYAFAACMLHDLASLSLFPFIWFLLLNGIFYTVFTFHPFLLHKYFYAFLQIFFSAAICVRCCGPTFIVHIMVMILCCDRFSACLIITFCVIYYLSKECGMLELVFLIILNTNRWVKNALFNN